MSERVIDFSDIEIGDVLDIRLKGEAEGIIIGNAKISDFDSYDGSYYIAGVGYWLYEACVESIILKSRKSAFTPGLYINKDWADRPHMAIVYSFNGNEWSELSGEFGDPEFVIGDGWENQLVGLVPES